MGVKSLSPTQRTLRELRNRGMVAGMVERWNAHARIRQDLFGIIDIIALDPGRGVVGVQSTGTDFSGHFKKITQERAQEAVDWISTPGAYLELWAWRKVKIKRGGKAMVYEPRIYEFTLNDFQIEIDPFEGC